jgi:alpha-L-fucosidase
VLNPNSGIDAVTTKEGIHILVYNPSPKGQEWFNGRNELRVAVSSDGENWKDVYQLEKQEKGEFSYPAIIETSDGLLHVTYTYDRRNVKHVVLKL